MKCDLVQERLVAALDAGRMDKEAYEHCLSCPDCAQMKQGLASLFDGLDELPKPSFVNGADFVETLARFPEPTVTPTTTLGEVPRGKRGLWQELCELLARQPALGLGFAVVCFFLGFLVSRPNGGPTNTVETNRTLESLTDKIAALNEAVAIVQLEQASASERLQGLNWIGNHGKSNRTLINALAGVLESDENVNVRLAAIDALAGFSDEPLVRSLLIDSLKQPQSPLVSIALIEKLVPLADPVSLAVFQSIAADESTHEAVRERARSAIQSSI